MARLTRSIDVFRRCTASLALMTAALATAAPALGASIVTENGTKYAYYELVNTRPSPVSDLVLAGVVPPTAIVPPPSAGPSGPNLGPLTIVKGSSGFDANNLPVITSPPGANPAGIGFDFTTVTDLANPANFKYSRDPSYNLSNTPSLTLQAPDADLTMFSYTPTAPNAAPGAATNTPEPVSLALWSALAGAGLIRARAFRRARRQATA